MSGEYWLEVIYWLKNQCKSNTAEESIVPKLLGILDHINKKFSWYNSLEAPIHEALTETLKLFRVCVSNEDVARSSLSNPSFPIVFHKLMECIFTKKNGPELFTKYLLQLFLNLLSVGNVQQRKEAREFIRKWFYSNFYVYFIGGYGYIYEISALLYNILVDVDLTDDYEGLINSIILYHGDPHKTNEFLDFLMEKIITSNYIWCTYDNLNVQTKLTLLSCLKEVLINSNTENLLIKIETLPLPCLEQFIATFNKSSNIIFQVSQADCIKSSQEIAYIVELLSHVSSDERYLKYLQNNKDIFINAGMLLLNIHRLGQMSNNIFTPIQNLSQNENPSSELRNPIFGFKADLVRLLGNLCWKNRKMQDLAREAEIIPVLLDCCNIDEKNPFIIQWVILAIRNICEKNKENQSVIAGLTQQGVIHADVLSRCGLTLHAEEELSIGLIGLNLNR